NSSHRPDARNRPRAELARGRSRCRYHRVALSERNLFSAGLASRNEFDPSRIVAPGAADKSESAMDILAGMLAYLAGIGVIFGGLALSLLLFTATPKQPRTPQSPVATAMRVAPNAAAKTPDAQANAKHPDSRSEKFAEKLGKHAPPAARPPDAARL